MGKIYKLYWPDVLQNIIFTYPESNMLLVFRVPFETLYSLIVLCLISLISEEVEEFLKFLGRI